MFTWVCSECGGSVDVSEVICPHCSAPAEDWDEDDVEAVAEFAGETDPPNAMPEPVAAELPVVDEPEIEEPPADLSDPEPERPADFPPQEPAPFALALSLKHLLQFAVGLVLVILAAYWLAGGGGMPGLQLEDPPEEVESTVETFAIGVSGPVEVSAIRPYYDREFQTHVRAFVANHSKEPQSVAFSVLLRVREATSQVPPLATFRVVLPEPLPASGGQEVDVPLAAMGSLQALPPWHQLRVDLEPL